MFNEIGVIKNMLDEFTNLELKAILSSLLLTSFNYNLEEIVIYLNEMKQAFGRVKNIYNDDNVNDLELFFH